MKQGSVKFYRFDLSWGIIKGDDGVEYFFHGSNMAPDILYQDQIVHFDAIKTTRGNAAVNVILPE